MTIITSKMLSDREQFFLVDHQEHMLVLARGTPAERRQMLDEGDVALTRALASACQHAHVEGLLPQVLHDKRPRKIETLLGTRKSIAKKQKLVQSQRGGAFFGSLAKAVLPALGGLAGTLIPIPCVGSAIGGAAGKLIADQI